MGAAGADVEDSEADGRDHENDRRPGGEPGEDVSRGTGPKSGLRTLAAKGSGEVSRTALLEQDDSDKKEAHYHVDDDDDVEKNMHC